MPKIQNLDGSIFDTETGELTFPEKPVEVDPSDPPKRAEPVDVRGIANQLSWGFNSALFDLPDAITEGIGKVLGIDNPVKLGDFMEQFNRSTGETAPKNMPERYARNVGDFLGITLPITGILAKTANSGVLGRAEKTGKLSTGVSADNRLIYSGSMTKDTARGIAKDTLDYIRKNPKEALFLDLAFTGAFAGIDQSIEEFMEEGEAKQITKAFAPILFFPAAVGTIALGEALVKLSPIRATRQFLKDTTKEKPEDIASQKTTDILTDDPRLKEAVGQKTIKLPLVKKVVDEANKRSVKTAAKQLDEIFKVLKDPNFDEGKAFQFAKTLENFQKQNPELFKGLDFKLDIAQLADSATLNKMIHNYRKTLPANVAKTEILRQNQLLENFATLFSRATPQEKEEAVEFLRIAYALNKKNVDELNERAGKLGQTEKEKLAKKYSFITLDDIGAFFERGILQKLEQVDKNFELRAKEEGFTRRRDGIDLATRDRSKVDPDELVGEVLPGIPKIDLTKFVQKFFERFKLDKNFERDFKDVSPSRIYNLIENFVEKRTNQLSRRIEEGLKTSTNKNGEGLGVPGFREYILTPSNFSKKKGFPKQDVTPLVAITRRAVDEDGKPIRLEGQSIAPELQDHLVKYANQSLEQQLNAAFNYSFMKFYKDTGFKSITGNKARDATTGLRIKDQDRSILYYPSQEQIDTLLKNYFKKENYNPDVDLIPKITLTLPDAISLLGKMRGSLANTQTNLFKDFQDFNKANNFLRSQQSMFDVINKEMLRGFNKEGKDIGKFVKEYQDTFSFFKNNLGKKALDPETSQQKLASFLLKDASNLRGLNNLFLKEDGTHVSSYITNLEKAVISKITGNNPQKTFMKDGEFDLKAFATALKTKIDPSIRKNLPEELKVKLNNAEVMATKILSQRQALVDKANAIKEGEFMVAIRPYVDRRERFGEAELYDYGKVIRDALANPQLMSVLKKESDRLLAKKEKGVTKDTLINPLRSLVWKYYKEQIGFGKNIFDVPNKMLLFLTNPTIRSSLQKIYSPKELENLEKLAELERRILKSGRVEADLRTGLQSFDDSFKNLFGFGLQTLESSTRAAFVTQKMSPVNMFVGLGARLLGRQQMNVYDATMFTSATNPKLAEKLVNSVEDVNSIKGLTEAKKVLNSIGFHYNNVFDDMTGFTPRAIMATKVAAPIQATEVAETLVGKEERKVPLVSPPTQTSRTVPSLDPVKKTTSAPPAQIRPEFARTYEALFPDDYITTLLKQRQQ